MKVKETAYLIQATLIACWWIGLFADTRFYEAFQFSGIEDRAFNSFLLPDLISIALLSIIRAYRPWKKLDYVILGAFSFASLFCINATFLSGDGLLSTSIMVLGLCYNLFLVHSDRVFRGSNTDNYAVNALKTLLQTICVWIISLVVIPAILLNAFGGSLTGISTLQFIAIVCFILFSTLGLSSAFSMVKNGLGTPLPLDQTKRLVTSGAYRYVRNPMAIAGIGQALCVGLLFTSIPILVYSILGALLWNFVVRPIEEKDMSERFGPDYDEYQKQVKCWIPSMRNKQNRT